MSDHELVTTPGNRPEWENSPAARRAVWVEVLRHVAGGFELETCDLLGSLGPVELAKKYPQECKLFELHQAMRAGARRWENLFLQLVQGKLGRHINQAGIIAHFNRRVLQLEELKAQVIEAGRQIVHYPMPTNQIEWEKKARGYAAENQKDVTTIDLQREQRSGLVVETREVRPDWLEDADSQALQSENLILKQLAAEKKQR